MGNAQIVAMTTSQLNALTLSQLAVLSTAQVAAITGAQIKSLASLNSLSLPQFAVLTVGQIAALSPAQVGALPLDRLQALTTTQIRAITTAGIAAMSISNLSGLTADQLKALSAPQRAVAMTVTGGAVTPLMLDLDGNGVQTLGLDAGVQFDVANLGRSGTTGWVGPNDGLLVMDRNGNGLIDNGAELFGSATLLDNGSQAADGFVALQALDANADGVIDVSDPTFVALGVWIDANSDGLTQSGELKRLDDLGVVSLHLDATPVLGFDNGNLVGLTSSYDTAGGATRQLADVWLLAGAAPVGPAMAVTVSNLAQSLRFFEQDQGEALDTQRIDTGDRSTAAPWSSGPWAGLTAELSGFVAQSSGDQCSGAMPPSARLTDGVMLAPASTVLWVDDLRNAKTGAAPG
jgi:hypothetical protein